MIKKFLKYSIWWWLAAVLDLFILWILVEFLDVHYILAAILAFSISLTFGYITQKKFTFENNETDANKHIKYAWIFVVTQIIGLIIYVFLLWVLTEKIWLYYITSAIIAKWIIFIRNFVINYYYNFK